MKSILVKYYPVLIFTMTNKMKKLLGILVLGLLFCSNAFSEILHIKCYQDTVKKYGSHEYKNVWFKEYKNKFYYKFDLNSMNLIEFGFGENKREVSTAIRFNYKDGKAIVGTLATISKSNQKNNTLFVFEIKFSEDGLRVSIHVSEIYSLSDHAMKDWLSYGDQSYSGFNNWKANLDRGSLIFSEILWNETAIGNCKKIH